MKTVALLFVLTFSDFGYAKEVPGPNIWYNFSEKILIPSYQLLGATKSNSACRNVAQKTLKTKTLQVTYKYKPKKQIVLPDYLSIDAGCISGEQNKVWNLSK